MQAGVYQISDLKAESQSKDPQDFTIDDLPDGANKTEAQSRDVVAFVNGEQVTVLSPTGSLAQALEAVKVERAFKGI